MANVDEKKKKFEDWIKNFPAEFPEIFEHDNAYHNPFIQDQPEYTYKAVFEGLKFLEEIALPWPGDENFSLGENATWGYIHILQCLSTAIEFEQKHRSEGGFEVPVDEG